MKTFSYMCRFITHPILIPGVYITFFSLLLIGGKKNEPIKIDKEFYKTILLIG